MKKSNQPDLITDLTAQAESGDAHAQYQLGMLYLKERCFRRKEAIQWLLKAAGQGHADAQNEVGEMLLEEGNGIGKNPKEAFRWFSLSAKQGNAEACINLADAYAEGIGCDASVGEASYWYQKAVDLGEWKGLLQLGVMYLNGVCTPVDEGKAEEYFCKLVEHDDVGYSSVIDWYRRKGQSDKAFEWMEKGAAHGDAFAQYELGKAYERDKIFSLEQNTLKRDMAKAMEWYQKAADHEDMPEMKNRHQRNAVASARCELGKAYERGIFYRRNMAKAKDWYQKAVALGSGQARWVLERLAHKESVLKTQEEYFLRLVEEKKAELIEKPNGGECELVYSYNRTHDNRTRITISIYSCPMPFFREFAMYCLLMSYADCLVNESGEWIMYAARAFRYFRKLPAETRCNELGFFYSDVAGWYEKSGDDRRAAWYKDKSRDWAMYKRLCPMRNWRIWN